MTLNEVLTAAARHGAQFHVHIHLEECGSACIPDDSKPTHTADLTPLGDKILGALRLGAGPTKKEDIIRAVFGNNATSSQGRAVTRELGILALRKQVRSVRHGWWEPFNKHEA